MVPLRTGIYSILPESSARVWLYGAHQLARPGQELLGLRLAALGGGDGFNDLIIPAQGMLELFNGDGVRGYRRCVPHLGFYF